MTAVSEAIAAVITMMPVGPQNEMGEGNCKAKEKPIPPVPTAVAKAPAAPTVSPVSETASGPKAVTVFGLDDVIAGDGLGVGLHRRAGMNGGGVSRLDRAECQDQGGNRHS